MHSRFLLKQGQKAQTAEPFEKPSILPEWLPQLSPAAENTVLHQSCLVRQIVDTDHQQVLVNSPFIRVQLSSSISEQCPVACIGH